MKTLPNAFAIITFGAMLAGVSLLAPRRRH
jgi:hypothetical protein